MTRKPASFFLFLILLLTGFVSYSFGAERTEPVDQDKDGRKETNVFYEGDRKVRAEIDKNGDGKTDSYIKFQKGVRFSAEADADFDGKIDTWYLYDPKGSSKSVMRDTNKDGKPDQFTQMIQGRGLVLKEHDKNYDGKIDKRTLNQWDGNKSMSIYTGGRMQRIAVPGYVVLWVEEDSNFDGKVDAYRERGNKNPSKTRVGQPMQTSPALPDAAPAESQGSSPEESEKTKTRSEKLIEGLNERYGSK